MYTHRIETRVTADHHVVFDLPPSFPEGEVEIVVQTKSEQSQAKGETLIDFLDWLKTQAPTGRSKADIEAQIAEERDSWGES